LLNLFMAVVWLALGAGLLLWQYAHPDEPGMTIFGSRYSVGWFALVLCLYNLARWWSGRRSRVYSQALHENRSRRHSHRSPRPDQPPDPNFIFEDESRSSGQGQ
jgi:hypothetical protein